MKKNSLLLVIMILLGCTSAKHKNNNYIQTAFIDFVNNYEIKITRDDKINDDKKFSMKVPNNFKKVVNRSGNFFFHQIEYSNNEKIISIYMPFNKYGLDFQILDCNYDEFIGKMKTLGIDYIIDDVKIRTNRRFSLTLKDDNFFVIYININKKNVEKFNYSINSLSFR